jgi:hypothetical protein
MKMIAMLKKNNGNAKQNIKIILLGHHSCSNDNWRYFA